MKKPINIAALVGLGLLIVGALLYNIKGRLTPLTTGLLLGAGALLLIYFIGNFGFLKAKLAQRSTRHGLNLVLMTLLVLGIIGFVQVIATKRHIRYDLTENKRYSLSPQSQQLLRTLPGRLTILCFYTENNRSKPAMEELMKEYKYYGDQFEYQFIDPDRNPAQARQYEIKYDGTAIVIYQDKTESVLSTNEEEITNAIIKVTRKKSRSIYFTTGHGEVGIDNTAQDGYSLARKALENQAYQVKEILLMREKQIPTDCDLMVVSGPQTEFFDEEIELITQFIGQGGKALFLLDPFTANKLSQSLERYGFEIGNDAVVDRFSRIMGGDYLIPVVTKYHDHDITRGFNIMSFFPFARSVKVKSSPGEGITASLLAETSSSITSGGEPTSWGETDRAALEQGEAQYDEGKDLQGPVPICAASIIEVDKLAPREEAPSPEERKEEEEEPAASEKRARVVVFGDSEFANNTYFSQQGNGDLFLNAVNWLAQEETLISIRPRSPKFTPLTLTASQGRVVFWLPVVLLPGLVIAIGSYIIIHRRRKG